MHMADGLVSPAVGGIMLAASLGVAAWSVRKIQKEADDRKIPMMGVMGAFVFAAQMINFAIPGTGSSGHIGGGILLAALLGPFEGFLTMASILLTQALFFGDGGLLAYGCNLFNMGFYACFLAYPLVFRWITRKGITRNRLIAASVLSVVAGLQLGAFSVVLETLFSGKTQLPFAAFVVLMQPIHLAIGLVEGLITSAVLAFIWKARPELLSHGAGHTTGGMPVRRVVAVMALAAVITGGVISWFASSSPDGLEWSMEKTAGTTEITATDPVHRLASDIQSLTAFLPDYSFRKSEDSQKEAPAEASARAGTSVSGLAGGAITLALAGGLGILVTRIKKRRKMTA